MKKVFKFITLLIYLGGCTGIETEVAPEETGIQQIFQSEQNFNINTENHYDVFGGDYQDKCNEAVCLMVERDVYDLGLLAVDVLWTNKELSRVGPGMYYQVYEYQMDSWELIYPSVHAKNSGVIGFLDKGESTIVRYNLIEVAEELTTGKYKIETEGWSYGEVSFEFEIGTEGSVDVSLENQSNFWHEVDKEWTFNEDLRFRTLEEVYEKDTLVITTTLENRGSDTFIYGESFFLEYEKDGKWFIVEKDLSLIEIGFIAIGYTLHGDSLVEKTYRLDLFANELLVGNYRIRTDVIRDLREGENSYYTERQYDLIEYFEVREIT